MLFSLIALSPCVIVKLHTLRAPGLADFKLGGVWGEFQSQTRQESIERNTSKNKWAYLQRWAEESRG